MQTTRTIKSPKYIILLHSIDIRMLQHSKVHSNVEHSFMHYVVHSTIVHSHSPGSWVGLYEAI